MKNKRKLKLHAFFTAFILGCAVLAGCSAKNNEGASSSNSTADKVSDLAENSNSETGSDGYSNAEASAQKNAAGGSDGKVLIYGSNDYTRINPAMDEHAEIAKLIFDGLMRNDEDNHVVAGLAEGYDYDEETFTYTFHIRDGIKWHDGEPFTADDVKFTIEAIMNPDNFSENAPDFEDIEEISVADEHTISFRLSTPNAAFTQYMTMAILPKHCLEGEDMQESEFFRNPIGTGAYKLKSWDDGQSIVLTKNEDYYRGAANISTIIFKIIPDDNAQAIQLKSGEIDLALLDPKNAAAFKDDDSFKVYDMTTADYRGILFNFANDYWTKNRDLIPAICYAIDRQAIVDAVLLGQGMTAYGPLQRNEYNNENVEHYDYNPEKAKSILEDAGCVMGSNEYYERNGNEIGFTISVMSGEQDRLDIAMAAAQQLREVGINCKVDVPAVMDWNGQAAAIIGWGSPFDADDHTYKVFGTDKGANYSAYSDAEVDKWLKTARESLDPEVRREAYARFQEALAAEEDRVLGHHGVGIFNNIIEWTVE